MEDKKYWIWLSRIKGINSVLIMKLLNELKTPKQLWNANEHQLKQVPGITSKNIKEIMNKEYRNNLEKYLEYMGKTNIKIITIFDEEYPQKLNNIYDKPIILFVKGNEKILNDKAVAIIGCRNASEYGKKVGHQLAYDVGNNNINIISGLARGIDTNAHIGALKSKAKTIAVLGNGLDMIYPEENKNIAQQIIKDGGAIVSEYIIGVKPEKMNFPARNRIISGLSDAVIVVEAQQKSGTLITVDFAIEQGKEVFAVPGNLDNINSSGTNELIKQGAYLITDVSDIIKNI